MGFVMQNLSQQSEYNTQSYSERLTVHMYIGIGALWELRFHTQRYTLVVLLIPKVLYRLYRRYHSIGNVLEL